jgi:hypothetical protein
MKRVLLFSLLLMSTTAFAQVDASQITHGTLPAGRIPAPTSTTLGGVKGSGGGLTCGAGSMQNGFASDGSIQCTPAIVPTPSASQTIVQSVGTSLNTNTFNGIRYVVPSDNWSQTLAVNLATPGAQTVTLTPCPIGLDTSNNSLQPFFVYIPTTNPEVVLLTGGTCTPGGASGTITFTTAFVHSATSNVLQSAYSGIQEAINDAVGTANNPNSHVVLPPTGADANAYIVRASIYVHMKKGRFEASGAIVNCKTRDRCIVLGDLVNSNHFGSLFLQGLTMTSSITADGCQITNTQRTSNVVTITVGTCSTLQTGDTVNINFTDNTSYWGNHGPVTVAGSTITYAQTGVNLASAATPGTIAILNAAVEDNAMPGTMDSITSSIAGGGLFNQFFVIDNDQAATIRNLNADGNQQLLCTANHCGSYVYSAGTTAATPVIWIDKANIGPQCGANGVTVLANNTTRITDSVIQGTAAWATNTSNLLGSFGGTTLDNLYNEEGPCTGSYHPYYPSASYAANNAGVIFEGNVAPLRIQGGEQPNGWSPTLLATNSGGTQYNYYIIVNDTTAGVHSFPLFAGHASTNGTGSITVQWPHIPPQTPGDTITYDLLRLQPSTLAGNTAAAPQQGACTGGSLTACGSVATGVAQCSGLVCTFTDTASANTSSYAISTNNFWNPILPYWPGGLVLTGSGSSNGSPGTGKAYIDTDATSTNSSPWISVAGTLLPTFFVTECSNLLAAQFGGAWKTCLLGDSSGNSNKAVGALLLQSMPATGGGTDGLKGRINIMNNGDIMQDHLITLVDSNPAKTFATDGNRPQNDPNDTYIGLDVPTGAAVAASAQLALGAPISISNYIANAGDNSSYVERVTASLKTFKVPIATPAATLALSTTAIAANTCAAAQTVALTGITTASVVKWSYASTPIGITGYGTGGLQVSTFATSGHANFVVCNITAASITPGAMTVNVREEQ